MKGQTDNYMDLKIDVCKGQTVKWKDIKMNEQQDRWTNRAKLMGGQKERLLVGQQFNLIKFNTFMYN